MTSAAKLFECGRCETRKPAAEMRQRDGKPIRICRACFAAAHAGRRAQPPRLELVKRAADPAPAAAELVERSPQAQAALLELSIPASLGVAAHIDAGRLVLTQARGDGSEDLDNITLTREEAAALFRRFAAWAEAAEAA